MRALNIKDQPFGRLVAESITRLKDGKRAWLCRCSCGGSKIVPAFHLRSGSVNSCGCLAGDITDQVFDKLTVLRKLGYKGSGKSRRMQWECRCECGGTCVTFARYLQRGTRTDCGCGDGNRAKATGRLLRKPVAEVMLARVYSSYRTNARKKKLVFRLSREDVASLIAGACRYCGQPPCRQFRNKLTGETAVYNGIDRLDNGTGYLPDNVASCCRECNFRKGTVNAAAFIAWAQRVADHQRTGVRPARGG